jgi:FixJ family two-component response regulator
MTIKTSRPQLAIVDDDADVSDFIKYIANEVGFDVEEYQEVIKFQASMEIRQIDVIVTDIVMPDMDGNELIMWLSSQGITAPVILMSGYGGKYLNVTNNLAQAHGVNVLNILTKPIGYDDMTQVLNKTIKIISEPARIY